MMQYSPLPPFFIVNEWRESYVNRLITGDPSSSSFNAYVSRLRREEKVFGGWKPVISSVIIRVETFNGVILLIATFFSPSLIYFIFFFLFFLESRIITTRI